MYHIVDTNVLLVASNKAPQASPTCIPACAKYLQDIMNKGVLVIDSNWIVINREYKKKNSQSGQPSVGDAFLLWVLRNQFNRSRCERVDINETSENEFDEFPKSPSLTNFDRSDRIFVAIALTHHAKPMISNAADSDWRNYEIALANHGVSLNFLCPELAAKV